MTNSDEQKFDNFRDSEFDDLFAEPADQADEAVMVEDMPVVRDKKTNKGKKEKHPKAKKAPKVKKEKPPKVKKEKKPKEPGEKQPWNVAALCFMAGFVVMLLAFGSVNIYAVMKHGISEAIVFLAIFDLLAAGALVIALLLRRSKNTATEYDVSLGIATIALIIGCMFLLANLACNFS